MLHFFVACLQLGEGAFSTVFLASLKRDPRQHVAVKRIRRTPDLKEEDIAMLRSEAEILQSVNHPNIIQL
jgi:serine/threonine protein kinase